MCQLSGKPRTCHERTVINYTVVFKPLDTDGFSAELQHVVGCGTSLTMGHFRVPPSELGMMGFIHKKAALPRLSLTRRALRFSRCSQWLV